MVICMAVQLPKAVRLLQQSSTRRKVDVFTTALRELQRSWPQLLQGGRVQIHSDSADAVVDCSRMRGAPDVFSAIRALFVLATELCS